MDLSFQTLCSSSGGNCLRLTCDQATLLIDCGFSTQRDCQAAIRSAGDCLGAIVSHAHSDHASYASLRVLGKEGKTVFAHPRVWRQVTANHGAFGGWKHVPVCHAFPDGAFEVGPFHIRHIELAHAPGVPNFGFVIHCGQGDKRRKIVTCTDFYNPQAMAEECVDADLLYVEANHDPELLRLFPNPSSRYHLSNPQTALLLTHALGMSARWPQAIVLGHLSRHRNRPSLAIRTITEHLDRAELKLQGRLLAAPPFGHCEQIRLF